MQKRRRICGPPQRSSLFIKVWACGFGAECGQRTPPSEKERGSSLYIYVPALMPAKSERERELSHRSWHVSLYLRNNELIYRGDAYTIHPPHTSLPPPMAKYKHSWINWYMSYGDTYSNKCESQHSRASILLLALLCAQYNAFAVIYINGVYIVLFLDGCVYSA